MSQPEIVRLKNSVMNATTPWARRLRRSHFSSMEISNAFRAAEAAEAAAVQGKFWEMHDELFTHQQALEDHHLLRYWR